MSGRQGPMNCCSKQLSASNTIETRAPALGTKSFGTSKHPFAFSSRIHGFAILEVVPLKNASRFSLGVNSRLFSFPSTMTRPVNGFLQARKSFMVIDVGGGGDILASLDVGVVAFADCGAVIAVTAAARPLEPEGSSAWHPTTRIIVNAGGKLRQDTIIGRSVTRIVSTKQAQGRPDHSQDTPIALATASERKTMPNSRLHPAAGLVAPAVPVSFAASEASVGRARDRAEARAGQANALLSRSNLA
jgi:hypothetical protein